MTRAHRPIDKAVTPSWEHGPPCHYSEYFRLDMDWVRSGTIDLHHQMKPYGPEAARPRRLKCISQCSQINWLIYQNDYLS